MGSIYLLFNTGGAERNGGLGHSHLQCERIARGISRGAVAASRPAHGARSLSQTTTRSGRSVLVCNLALIRICICANVYANVYILLIGIYPYIHLSIHLSIYLSVYPSIHLGARLRCLCQSKILLPRLRHLPLSFPRRLNAWARTQVRVYMSVRTHVWM